MSAIKYIVEKITNCEDCYGNGIIGWNNGEDYDFEYCDCNPYRLIFDHDKDVVSEGDLDIACNICVANEYNIPMIDTRTSTLCDRHYQDWSDEKNFGEVYA